MPSPKDVGKLGWVTLGRFEEGDYVVFEHKTKEDALADAMSWLSEYGDELEDGDDTVVIVQLAGVYEIHKKEIELKELKSKGRKKNA